MTTRKNLRASLITRESQTNTAARKWTSTSMWTFPRAWLGAWSTNDVASFSAYRVSTASLALFHALLSALMIFGTSFLTRMPTKEYFSTRMASMGCPLDEAIFSIPRRQVLTVAARRLTIATAASKISSAVFTAFLGRNIFAALHHARVFARGIRFLHHLLTVDVDEIPG